jgi:small subunit ribosomal protein S2
MNKINTSGLPEKAPEYDLMTLFEAGCHFGHQKSKWHPKMSEYIYTEKNGVHIFDLAKTAAQLQLAYNFIYDQASKGKKMVMVGTKKQVREIIETTAKDCSANYITSRWLGGFLTNWPQIKGSLKRMLEIEEGLESGKFNAYTKFERVQLEKEQGRLARFFEGLRNLKSTPDFLFVADIKTEKNAIKEANVVGIPVVAVVDSNSDPEGVDIVIPANDDAVRSLSFLITEISKAYKEGGSSAKSGAKTAVKTDVKTDAKTDAKTEPVKEAEETKETKETKKATKKE